MIVSARAATLSGAYTAPPSKSDCHRALIAAALASNLSLISPLLACDDVAATISALNALEADIRLTPDSAAVMGIPCTPRGHLRIHCGESGSTLRFLLPIVAAFGIEAVFTGSGRLPERPLGIYHDLFTCKGVELFKLESDELPLKITGRLQAGRYELAGNISSQFVTGLLFALPLLDGDSEIILTSPLESKPYVDMTLDTLAHFGITIEPLPNGYCIPGRQKYQPCTYAVEGDFSNSAFFAAAALSGNGIAISGLNLASRQGDREILNLIERFGGVAGYADGVVTISGGELGGIKIDAAQIPDLVPILAVIAATAQGTTHIYGASRLRLKESDRLLAITQELRKLNADISCDSDSITINGKCKLRGGMVNAHNDHRIAMSLAVAALFCDGEVFIDGAECINKSYPGFFEDYNRLGGLSDVRVG